MANLSGSLSQVGSAVLANAAATQFTAMNTDYTTANPGKSLVAIQGYMSVWDWAQEAASMWGTHHEASVQSTFATVIKPLLQKVDATEQDFNQVNDFFKNNVGGGRGPNFTSVYDFSKLPAGLAGGAWAAYTQTKLSWAHPYFQQGQLIYGVPNRIDKDPRRTGHCVVLDIKSSGENTALSWLFSNSHKYGFYWYGPTVELWMFIDPATSKLSQAKQNILSLYSYHANGYYVYKQEKGVEPASRIEIEKWGETKGDLGKWIMNGLTYESVGGKLQNYS
jgi:hypothetical protein